MVQQSDCGRELGLELTRMKRNPYLADYHGGRELRPTTHQSVRDRQRRNAERLALVRRQRVMMLASVVGVLGCVVLLVVHLLGKITGEEAAVSRSTQADTLASVLGGEKIQGISAIDYSKHPTWTEDFLTPNEYSRPGDALEEVNSIFVHYTGNKGTSAAQNRSYFEQLKDTHERSASAHFIIGYEGEIIQCVPLDEIAYAVKTRNMDSISIECCYLAEDGSFTQETYDSLVVLLQWLIATYDLDTEDILRHYDCGGKRCPVYYTENEDAWELLKKDVETL